MKILGVEFRWKVLREPEVHPDCILERIQSCDDYQFQGAVTGYRCISKGSVCRCERQAKAVVNDLMEHH